MSACSTLHVAFRSRPAVGSGRARVVSTLRRGRTRCCSRPRRERYACLGSFNGGGRPEAPGCRRGRLGPRKPLSALIGKTGRGDRIEVERALVGLESLPALERVLRAGDALGCGLRHEQRTVESLISDAAALPALTVSVDQRPWVLVSGGTTGAMLVAPDDGRGPRFVTWAELRDALGLAPNATQGWVVAARETGMDGVRASTPGGHGIPPLQRLLAWVKLEKDDVGGAVVYAVGVGLLSLATPLGVQFLVNTVAFGALVQPLVVLSLLVAAGLSFAAILRALQAYVVERLQQRIFARVAMDLAQRLPRVRLDALDGRHGPELMNRFFEVVSVQKGAATMLVDGVAIVLHTLGGALLLAFYHPFLLAFDVVLIASIALIVVVLGRGAIATAIKESKQKFALAAWLQETARHVEVFKLQNADRMARARAEALTLSYLQARRKHFRIVFRQLIGALAVQALRALRCWGSAGGS